MNDSHFRFVNCLTTCITIIISNMEDEQIQSNCFLGNLLEALMFPEQEVAPQNTDSWR